MALVITIIILLILAGITINMLTGENGLLTKAKEAQEASRKAFYQDEIDLIIAEKQIEKATNISEIRKLIELVAEGIRGKDWQETTTICDDEENDQIEPKDGTRIIVETKDGYEIIVKIDNEKDEGKVESIIKGTGQKWKTSYKISLNSNNGTGSMKEINVLPENKTILPANTFEKTGYIFKEWNTKSDGTGTRYKDEETINEITENITLYAIWKEEIIANLIVTNNKFTEGTKITLGGEAKAKGIQKVELKVGDNILYEENIENNKTNYSKENLELGELKQDALYNLNFYEINLQLVITSATGEVGETKVGIRNYTIGSDNAFYQMANVVNGGNPLAGETIIQLKDIATTNYVIPIGYGEKTDPLNNCKYFAGIYDGKGKSIVLDGIGVLNTNIGTLGIFGVVKGGTVKNLNVSGQVGGAVREWCGTIVGVIENGVIYNCRSSAENSSGYSNDAEGGICGIARASRIENCCNANTISSKKHVGGIVGRTAGSSSRIYSCYNTGSISAFDKGPKGSSAAGGIVGAHISTYIDIQNCYNTGKITGSYPGCGGILGALEQGSDGTMHNCYNVGNVSAPSKIGSFLGEANTKWTFWNSYNAVSDLVAVGEGQNLCEFNNSRKVTITELKGLAGTLGNKYKNDTGKNNGYPILEWQ